MVKRSFEDFSNCWDNMTRAEKRLLLNKTKWGRTAFSEEIDDRSRMDFFDFAEEFEIQLENAMIKLGVKCFK